MITREAILEALRDVEDPEVHKSIVELEMVRRIDISGNHVGVEVALTISGCPLRTKIENEVTEKLRALDGVETVEVVIGTMNDEERSKFTAKLRGTPEKVDATPAILDPASGTTFLSIASGKGGVGKSTVTANLARALAAAGVRVGIIDADIYGFSIPGIFGVKPLRPTVIDDLIIPIEIDGVKLISMHFFVPDNSPVVWRGPMLGKMLRNFFGEVHWGNLDVLLLDLPPGTGDIAMDIHSLLPGSKQLIVTTPQSAAADVAVRAGVMGMRTNHPILGVVENMAYYQCPHCGEKIHVMGQGGGDRVAKELRTNVVARIPMAQMDDGKTSLFPAESPQGKVYQALARDVMSLLNLSEQVHSETLL